MKRFFTIVALLVVSAVVVAGDYSEGKEYVAISPAPPVASGDKVEVAEFFWFGCPHCYRLEPFVNTWLEKKPENVEFVRVPVMFGGAADLHAKMYYALESMGELERLSTDIFETMHEKKNKLKTPAAVEAYLKAKDVDIEKYNAAMNSFSVQTKARRSATLMKRYGITGVPALVVDARYRTGSVGSYQEMLEVTDHLVEKAAQQRNTVE